MASFFKLKTKKSSAEQPPAFAEAPSRDSKIVGYSWGELVATPPGIPEGEWVAAHTGTFFRNINIIYATLNDYCTAGNCAVMSAGPKNEIVWVDERGKKGKAQPAPQYIDLVCAHVQSLLDDEAVFPTRADAALPKDFMATNRRIYRLLLHVLAHMYHGHYDTLLQLGLVPHLNSLFAHFTAFCKAHALLDAKDAQCMAMADLMKHFGW